MNKNYLMFYSQTGNKKLIKKGKRIKENLIKCTVKTSNNLIVECEISSETIKELKTEYLVSVREIQK